MKRTLSIIAACLCAAAPASAATHSQAIAKANSWASSNCGDFYHICGATQGVTGSTSCNYTGISQPNRTEWSCRGSFNYLYWPTGHWKDTGVWFCNIGPADVVLWGKFYYN